MRKMAIVATRCKPSEDILVDALLSSGHEVIIAKPRQDDITRKLKEISERSGHWEILFFAEKDMADWTKAAAAILNLQIEVCAIWGKKETRARVELAKLWPDDESECG
jgi:hypothetical protein